MKRAFFDFLISKSKLFRYSKALQTFVNVIRKTKEQLIIALTFLVITLIIAASLMFVCENPAQPDKFSSIPGALWWAIATLTTIGYGDIYPITALGKFFAGIIAVVSLGMVALPAGIIGSGFVDEMEANKAKKANEPSCCPHCNKSL